MAGAICEGRVPVRMKGKVYTTDVKGKELFVIRGHAGTTPRLRGSTRQLV